MKKALGERFFAEAGEIASLFRGFALRSSLAAEGQRCAEHGQTHQRDRARLGDLRWAAIGRAHNATCKCKGLATSAHVLELHTIWARERNPISQEVASGYQGE